MKTILEIWHELFEREPEAAEIRVMERIASFVDPEDAVFIQCAVTVHALYSVLLLDPNSPVRLTARVAKALKELETKASHLGLAFNESIARISMLKSESTYTLRALDRARDFADWQSRHRVTVFRKDAKAEETEYSVSFDTVVILAVSVFIATIFGGLVVLGVGLIVWSNIMSGG